MSTDGARRTAIIILNWNGLEDTRRCLAGLLQLAIPADLYVLDNGSGADEAAVLRKAFPQIVIERSETNLGFTGGNNYWLQRLSNRYEYYVLLNQDTVTTADWLTPSIHYLDDHTEAAVVGPSGANVSLWTGKVTQLPADTTGSADCVMGYCCLIRSTALEDVGWLTEPYFAYYEEADWCLRARAKGWECHLLPQPGITHQRHHSFRTYYISRNMVWLMKRFANPLQLVVFFCYYFSIYWIERLRKGSTFRDLKKAARDGWLKSL